MAKLIDSGPVYMLIVAISVVGFIGALAIFMNSDNRNIAIIVGAIVSLASLAYAIQANAVKAIAELQAKVPASITYYLLFFFRCYLFRGRWIYAVSLGSNPWG